MTRRRDRRSHIFRISLSNSTFRRRPCPQEMVASSRRMIESFFQESEGRTHLVEEFSVLRRSNAENRSPDSAPQQGKAPSISWVPFAETVPATTSCISSGLISEEHFTRARQEVTRSGINLSRKRGTKDSPALAVVFSGRPQIERRRTHRSSR